MREIKIDDLSPEHIGALAMGSSVHGNGEVQYVGKIVGYVRRIPLDKDPYVTVYFGFIPDQGSSSVNRNPSVTLGISERNRLFLI